jgi:hypothetical protein
MVCIPGPYFDGNVELQQFIQRSFGYCLTGSVLEHAFVFGHGSGGNGKGTMLNTIAWVFSDYVTVADMGTRKQERATPDRHCKAQRRPAGHSTGDAAGAAVG